MSGNRGEVITLVTPETAAYGRLTAAAARAYAAGRGCAFRELNEAPAGLPPEWARFAALLEALEGGAAWALWLDADALVLNPSLRAESFAPGGGLFAGETGGSPDPGALLALPGGEAALKELAAQAPRLAGEGVTPAEALAAALAAGLPGLRALPPRTLVSGRRDYGFEDFALHLRGMGAEARRMYVRTLYSRVYEPGKPRKTVMHGGDMGDVVYSVPLFRALGASRVVLNPESPYRTKMNAAACGVLRPLLEAQGFEVEISPDRPGLEVDYYADIFREGASDMENNHLAVTNSEKIIPGLDVSGRYLDAPPKRVADVIVSRSARYRNPDFDWLYLLDGLPDEVGAAFVGLKSEYEAFRKATALGDRVFYYPTADLRELASVIAGCRVFIGNQSSPYAVAEGLKVNRIQETCRYTPNCRAQSGNGVDVESREHLYGAKLKLFDWLGLEADLPRPPRRALLFTTCYISNGEELRRVTDWLDYYLPRLERLGVGNVLLADDGSPREWLAALKRARPELEVSGARPLPSGGGRCEIPGSIARAPLSLVTFPERLGRRGRDVFPGWWRSYSFGAAAAQALNFEKFVFVETDAYIYSDRLFNWTANAASGFNSLYSRRLGAREPSLQTCARSEFHRASRFFLSPDLGGAFWAGGGLPPERYLPEHVLPFTNSLEAAGRFLADRYGEDAFPDIPEGADACFNLTDISLGLPRLRGERKLRAHRRILGGAAAAAAAV